MSEKSKYSYGSINKGSADETVYTLHQKRYVILGSFSMLSMINAWIWITWSPLTPSPICSLWNVSSSKVDELSSIYLYVYLLCSPASLWMVHEKGLRFTIITAAFLNFMGASIRYWDVMNYSSIYIGTILCAISCCILLPLPPLISGSWFGELERAKATSFGVFANQLGVAAGLGVTTIVNFQPQNVEDIITRYVGIQCFLSILAFLMILFWVRNDFPPTPASAAAYIQFYTNDEDTDKPTDDASDRISYLSSVSAVLSSPSKKSVTAVYGLSVGAFYAILTFLGQLFPTQSYTSTLIGSYGISIIFIGLLGIAFSGWILDTYATNENIYWKVLLTFLSSSLIFCVPLFAVLSTSNGIVLSYSFTIRLMFFLILGIGFSLNGVISVGFEYGSALCYPANDAIVAGILNFSAHLAGWVLVEFGAILMKNVENVENVHEFTWRTGTMKLGIVLASVLLFSCFLLCSVKEKSQRPVNGKDGPNYHDVVRYDTNAKQSTSSTL